jgi:hypothetical protein
MAAMFQRTKDRLLCRLVGITETDGARICTLEREDGRVVMVSANGFVDDWRLYEAVLVDGGESTQGVESD